MWFLLTGVVFVLLKWQTVGPVGLWPWWGVLMPFALAVLWWGWADSTGYTKRKAMEKENQRKAARIDRQRDSLGLAPKRKK